MDKRKAILKQNSASLKAARGILPFMAADYDRPIRASPASVKKVATVEANNPISAQGGDTRIFPTTHLHLILAQFLPRIAGSLTLLLAGGLRDMVVGMVFVSVIAGLVATTAGLVLDLPTWAILVAYPSVGSLSLLLVAAHWSIREAGLVREKRMVSLNAASDLRVN